MNPVMVPAFLWVMLLLGIFPAAARSSSPLTNYGGGIGIGLSGKDGSDYVFECWYHDALVDDHGTIYIKDSTKISLAHNERNTLWVLDKTSSLQTVDPSKGLIRYKVDRDLNYRYVWANAFNNKDPKETFPAYTDPFAFKDLSYAPDEPGVPVVGTTGPREGVELSDSAASRRDYYHRGMLDSAGDEWHILTVGDDDVGVDPGESGRKGGIEGRRACTDGKIFYFIVNPKTPAIHFTASGEKAQFYTTPVKNYFIPILHDQTTYVTDGVEIHLANIMGTDPVYYRFDREPFKKFTGPLAVTPLKDGEHTLEYYYRDSHHRTRRIVKNPGFPSDADEFAKDGPKQGGLKHGYLLWRDDAEFQRLKTRLTGPADSPDTAVQQKLFKQLGQTSGEKQARFDGLKRKGLRFRLQDIDANLPLTQALFAVFEGLDKDGGRAAGAKALMFENEMFWDQVGYELSNWAGATPGDDFTCGYYKMPVQTSVALAYDLLITRYRVPEYPGGFTPIEDLKVRDILCNYTWVYLLHRGHYNLGYEWMMFWATARGVGVLSAAMAMPSYDTPYYGTSGFNGASTHRKGLPYPDQAVTWYQLLYEDNVPKIPFPNQANDFGLLTSTIIPHTGMGGRKVEAYLDGCIDPEGLSTMKAYTSYHLMGRPIGIYANLMKINFNRSWDWLDTFFEKCNDGTQQNDLSHNVAVGYYPNPLCINEYFPKSVAGKSLKLLREKGDYAKQDIYGLLFTRPETEGLGESDGKK